MLIINIVMYVTYFLPNPGDNFKQNQSAVVTFEQTQALNL
jgi:hypothetical protein